MDIKNDKEQIVNLVPCIEKGGRERLVVFTAHVAIHNEVANLIEDAKLQYLKEPWPGNSCTLGTSPALIKFNYDVESD